MIEEIIINPVDDTSLDLENEEEYTFNDIVVENSEHEHLSILNKWQGLNNIVVEDFDSSDTEQENSVKQDENLDNTNEIYS